VAELRASAPAGLSGNAHRIRQFRESEAQVTVGVTVAVRKSMLAPTKLFLVPSEPKDEDCQATELQLTRLRAQVAIVRMLTDQIEHFARAKHIDGLSEQLIEEMRRLGCRLIEAAASMTRAPESGVALQAHVTANRVINGSCR
jgi:ribosomal protein L29